MPRPVEAEHPEIFHYTTRVGLEGILKSNSIWATKYVHLNDSTEIILFKDKLKEILTPVAREIFVSMVVDGRARSSDLAKHGGLDTAAKHDAAQFVESCFRSLEDEIYIASFCGGTGDDYVRRNGLLSQWRGYANGGGFCIEFNTRQLLTLLRKEAESYEHMGGHVSGVMYSDDEAALVKEFSDALEVVKDYVRDSFEKILNRTHLDVDADAAGKFLNAFVGTITRYKHCGFKEENEVRVVWVSRKVTPDYIVEIRAMGGEPRPEKPTLYRDDNGHKIAYVALLAGSDVKLPINRIIVGPQSHQRIIAEEIGALCIPLNIPVEMSDIPYVTR